MHVLNVRNYALHLSGHPRGVTFDDKSYWLSGLLHRITNIARLLKHTMEALLRSMVKLAKCHTAVMDTYYNGLSMGNEYHRKRWCIEWIEVSTEKISISSIVEFWNSMVVINPLESTFHEMFYCVEISHLHSSIILCYIVGWKKKKASAFFAKSSCFIQPSPSYYSWTLEKNSSLSFLVLTIRTFCPICTVLFAFSSLHCSNKSL